METEDIQNSVNEISNSDAENIIKQLKKESKGHPDRVLAEKLQKFFPDVQIFKSKSWILLTFQFTEERGGNVSSGADGSTACSRGEQRQ